MLRIAVVIVVFAFLSAPAQGRRKVQKKADALKQESSTVESGGEAMKYFFRPQHQRFCFQVPVRCGTGYSKKPVESEKECQRALTKWDSTGVWQNTDGRPELAEHQQNKVLKDYLTAGTATQLDDNRRGCVTRKFATTSTVSLHWIAPEENEYIGSDICGCYHVGVGREVKTFEATVEDVKNQAGWIKAAIEQSSDKSEVKGALVKVDGAQGVVVASTAAKVTVVTESSEPKELALSTVEVDQSSDAISDATLLMNKVGANCACYPKSLRAQCCNFGEVPKVRTAIKKGDPNEFYSKEHLADEDTCRQPALELYTTDCQFACRRHEELDSREGCTDGATGLTIPLE